jgi:hypothetical protein
MGATGCDNQPSSTTQPGGGTASNEGVDHSGKLKGKTKIVVGFAQIGGESAWRTANTESIKSEAAKRNMVRIPLKDGRTLHHETSGRHGAGKVIVRPAVQGTGIIAGGPMRAVFESLGVGDVVSKSLGTSNPYNMVRATFDAAGPRDIGHGAHDLDAGRQYWLALHRHRLAQFLPHGVLDLA